MLNHLLTETEEGVAQAIIRSVVDFKRDPWSRVSENAKDLVKKMLNPDPTQRLSAQQVLGTSSSCLLSNDALCMFSSTRQTSCRYIWMFL